MKTEINYLNKVKFFSQYWGQKVFCMPILYTEPVKNTYVFEFEDPEDIELEYLLLRPLSQISNEDLAGVDFTFPNGKPEDLEMEFYPESHDIHWQAKSKGNVTRGVFRLDHWDYLRSKGYALPWLGLSVDEMVEAGWIKLSES